MAYISYIKNNVPKVNGNIAIILKGTDAKKLNKPIIIRYKYLFLLSNNDFLINFNQKFLATIIHL